MSIYCYFCNQNREMIVGLQKRCTVCLKVTAIIQADVCYVLLGTKLTVSTPNDLKHEWQKDAPSGMLSRNLYLSKKRPRQRYLETNASVFNRHKMFDVSLKSKLQIIGSSYCTEK